MTNRAVGLAALLATTAVALAGCYPPRDDDAATSAGATESAPVSAGADAAAQAAVAQAAADASNSAPATTTQTMTESPADTMPTPDTTRTAPPEPQVLPADPAAR